MWTITVSTVTVVTVLTQNSKAIWVAVSADPCINLLTSVVWIFPSELISTPVLMVEREKLQNFLLAAIAERFIRATVMSQDFEAQHTLIQPPLVTIIFGVFFSELLMPQSNLLSILPIIYLTTCRRTLFAICLYTTSVLVKVCYSKIWTFTAWAIRFCLHSSFPRLPILMYLGNAEVDALIARPRRPDRPDVGKRRAVCLPRRKQPVVIAILVATPPSDQAPRILGIGPREIRGEYQPR